MLLAVTVSGAAVAILKPTFARPGPGGPGEPKAGESWISARYGRFPSSHAAMLFSGATALAEFLPATAPAGYAIAVLVCHERLYEAAHFPSDVFAGAWLGIVLARFIVGRLARSESWSNDLAPPWRGRRSKGLEVEPVWSELNEASKSPD